MHESLITAREYKGEADSRVNRVTNNDAQEPKRGHYLCNTTHPPGKCPQVCKHCGKKGSHLEDKCWEKYPELKLKYTPRKKRIRMKRKIKIGNQGGQGLEKKV